MLFGDLIATAAGVLVIRIYCCLSIEADVISYLSNVFVAFYSISPIYVLYWVYPNLVPIHLEVVT